jgi:acylphosphatase
MRLVVISFAKFRRGSMSRQRVHIFYSGRVQGVGFRHATKMVATGFEVSGVVRNLPDGRVELMAEGARAELEAFLKAIEDSAVGGLIRQAEANWGAAKNEFRGFEIVR